MTAVLPLFVSGLASPLRRAAGSTPRSLLHGLRGARFSQSSQRKVSTEALRSLRAPAALPTFGQGRAFYCMHAGRTGWFGSG